MIKHWPDADQMLCKYRKQSANISPIVGIVLGDGWRAVFCMLYIFLHKLCKNKWIKNYTQKILEKNHVLDISPCKKQIFSSKASICFHKKNLGHL